MVAFGKGFVVLLMLVVFYVLAKSIVILFAQASGRWREAVQGPHIAGSGNQALVATNLSKHWEHI